MYILWNTRVGGWFAPGGTYISDHRAAQQFSREDATLRIKRSFSKHDSSFGLIPVPVVLLEDAS